MDFSIPPNLPLDIQNKLNELIQDYKDENLTVKGYETKRKLLLENHKVHTTNPFFSHNSINSSMTMSHKSNVMHIPGRNQSLYLNNVAADSTSTMSSPVSKRESIAEMQHSIYRVTTINSNSGFSTPRRYKRKSSSIQLSLPFNSSQYNSSDGSEESNHVVYDPMFPLLPRPLEEKKSNGPIGSLPLIVRGRFEHYGSENAMISVNSKGKETFISWDKLYLRAEKVANELTKHKLYRMDKVLLWYNKEEIIEFTVALLGCFIAGMVAVPISFESYSLGEIIEIIKLTNSKFILLSNECHKQLDNLHSTSNNTKIKLIKNEFFQQITFLKTDDLGTYSKAKKSTPTFDIPNVSYIEFTRTPLGRLSGVVMKHKILINQFVILSDILDSRSMPHWKKKNIRRPFDKKIPQQTSYTGLASRFVILNTLDPTRSTGLIFGVLFNIFSGNLLISVDTALIEKPGGYENLVAKYRADILLNDQLQLKQIVINFLENPELAISKKKQKVDFSCIKCCLTSCTTIDTEVTEMVVHKWLKNLGCIDAPLCYSPMLTLLDFGGIFISTRDQLGHLENFPIHDSKLRLQDQVFVNKEKLKSNIVESSITAMINSSSSFKDYLKLETFGFPIPGMTLCVVNPDDNTLVPDLSVGEIWISSNFVTDEFYQMDKVNDFVFKAKLNYPKMFSFLSQSNELPERSSSSNISKISEKLDTVLTVCPANTPFLRTKLMGFVYNGKIYVLSLIEDMFLQNKLVRLPNWSHTSDLSKVKKVHKHTHSSGKNSISSRASTIKDDSTAKELTTVGSKRQVQTHYLQQITETVVRTVNTVFEVSAFEINENKDEHFLVMVVESSLAKSKESMTSPDGVLISMTDRQKAQFEKSMNDLTDQIYRILWIFHKIQPMCIVVVPKDSLPRRYCSLELANSTVEKKFLNGELQSKFVKFQFDNIILDFVPHSGYYNESIFSEHLSNLRRTCLGDIIKAKDPNIDMKSMWQTSGIDYRDTSLDVKDRTKKLTDFKTILEILEWRIANNGNEAAFTDGGNSTYANSNNNENNFHSKVSWKSFGHIVGSFLKKIVGSKVPLSPNDRVIIMCDNSVEYVAIVMACFYCNFVIIPLPIFDENNVGDEFQFLTTIIKSYKVKRIFVDARTHNLLDNHPATNKIYKRYKALIPKITVFSKIKIKSDLTIRIFKNTLLKRFSYRPGVKSNTSPCVVWVNQKYDTLSNIHVTMTHHILMNSCKILKETLQLSNDSSLFSVCSHTFGIGFLNSCLLGIYVGSTTSLFALSDVTAEPRDFLFGLQNLPVKDLFLELNTFRMLMEKASMVLKSSAQSRGTKSSSKDSGKNSSKSSILRADFMRNIQNLMIPFSTRPDTVTVENLLRKYDSILITSTQINYVYEHHFNALISLRSYLDIPPVDLYLDAVSLREGIVKEVDPSITNETEYIRIQDSGTVPVCTDVSITNPETLLPCFDGEFGEIWCCSEGNVFDYYISDGDKKLLKDPFITQQFKSKFDKKVDNGLTYLRTGDLGFIKNVTCKNSEGTPINLNLLFVLGSINETIEVLGLTHFVSDLERTVKATHGSIINCIISKAGGLLVCLVQCSDSVQGKLGNITSLIVSGLLNVHGIVLDLCTFVKMKTSRRYNVSDWANNRTTVMEDWFSQELEIEEQYGINYGENISIYLLSDFEKGN
ncbi:hypothetical protein NCAS_0B06750 [Naumovozyma castellii]|uniref:DMAP1-binding domain-containing protein n=1 Tax=Naumovozyma castellii TaxID=27288 RepID=G0VA29_NAUCA|nr:hypothetical protein NCAS_0B06750 [Naumovozyma castellii CBS 4309]CCC68759.1 hypothetical protein NCAS_0B06750 [Naumovozyma castellii CBS 4309]